VKPKPSSAGFAPEKLDPIVEAFFASLKTGQDELEKIRPVIVRLSERVLAEVETIGSDPEAREALHDRLLGRLERYSKLLLNFSKSADELTRLRSFVAGGADSRPDLGDLDDQELEKLVLNAAKGLQGPEEK
jgi:hypothetical protein